MDVGTISAGSSSSDATAMLLELREVSVRFGGITALDSVSFDVNRGQICGLIGPNGAGKTTLFDVVSGVRRPQRGWVSLDGVDISSFDPVKRCQAGLRRTFQRFQLFGWLTVEDNVLAAIEWHGGGGGFVGDMVGWPGRRRRERERLMRAHGASGRTFAGRVVQLITGSTGLDEFEWGVTLFGVHPDDLKDTVYTMRFDEAAALYAEFGPSYSGVVGPVEEVVAEVGLTG